MRADMGASTPRDLDAAFRAQFDATFQRLRGDLTNIDEEASFVSDAEVKPIRAWQRDSSSISPWQRRSRSKPRNNGKKIAITASVPAPSAADPMQAPSAEV